MAPRPLVALLLAVVAAPAPAADLPDPAMPRFADELSVWDVAPVAPGQRVRFPAGDASLAGRVAVEGRRRLLGAEVVWADGRSAARIDVGRSIGNASIVLE
jgi:hypothetical protein